RGRGTRCADRGPTDARPGSPYSCNCRLPPAIRSLAYPSLHQINRSRVQVAFATVRRRLLGTRMLRDPIFSPVAQGRDAMTSRPGPLICVVIPCYNEQGNIGPLYERITHAFATIPDQRYCLLFIDNASTDGTVEQIKDFAAKDRAVRLIINVRNFGA